MSAPTNIIASDHFSQRLASLEFTGHALQVTGKTVEYIVPPLCEVSRGTFLMGDDKRHSTALAFAIARYPVTVAEYACFVRAGQREPSQWQEQVGKLDHPIVYVSWHDAIAYANWIAERTGQPWRLPTEAEWEKAARGTDGRIYPWGDSFDTTRCNTTESNIGTTASVGSYPTGASPYGVQDMAGNVWEWTESRYDTTPEYREYRVVRGGSWIRESRMACAAFRFIERPVFLGVDLGFRLVVASPLQADRSDQRHCRAGAH